MSDTTDATDAIDTTRPGPSEGLVADPSDPATVRSARSFGVAASVYHRARPGYPVEAVAWLVGDAQRVLDLGAGTGKLTEALIELDREMEEAAQSLGASQLTTFRRVVLPNLVPAIVSGVALAFARAVGEFGSVVLISGNKPFDTQVASVYAYKQIESDNITGAAAVSVVLLALSLAVLLGLRLVERWGTRHDS